MLILKDRPTKRVSTRFPAVAKTGVKQRQGGHLTPRNRATGADPSLGRDGAFAVGPGRLPRTPFPSARPQAQSERAAL